MNSPASYGRILITKRNDPFRERGYDAMFERAADVVAGVTTTEPLPYLPRNPDFGDQIKVIYALMTVV